MGVRQSPAFALERVIDFSLGAGHEVLPIVIAQNHPEIDALKVGVGLLKSCLEGGIVHRLHRAGIDIIPQSQDEVTPFLFADAAHGLRDTGLLDAAFAHIAERDELHFFSIRIARMQSREKSLCCNRLQASG